MPLAIPLAWLQITREKLRMAVALLGVAFAVVLIFMQLGFRDALFDSAVRYHGSLDYDVALVAKKTSFIVQTEQFSRRRLYQVLGMDGVVDVKSVYASQAIWRNPVARDEARSIFVVGFDPTESVFELPEVREAAERLQMPDYVLYDRSSRPEFGPVVELLESGQPVSTEISGREVTIAGLFELGTSFGIDAAVITSDLNFMRILPHRAPGLIDIGLISLAEGVDPDTMRDEIRAALPDDVNVYTRADFIRAEVDYWNRATPIGFVFFFGTIIGIVVGAIIVYQILFSDVSDHLQEYATLKAMGYSDGFLFKVVLQEAAILAVLGFLPGLLVCVGLYRIAGDATSLPIHMTWERGAIVLGLTLVMCCVSGAMALRKVSSADPADVF
jgi:putative ABC transport system permease protein